MTFLVSFGANLWALDNDFHTPLDVAVLNNHTDIVKYLDEVIAQQSMLNKKVVRKLKEKSVLDAQKRVKKYEKMQEKAQKRVEKEERLLAKERERMHVGVSVEESPVSSHSNTSSSSNGSTVSNNNNKVKSKHSPSSLLSRTASINSGSEPKPYSAYFNNSTKKTGVLTGVAKRIKQQRKTNTDLTSSDFKIGEVEYDGRRTIRSLSGFQRDHHVMYVRNGKEQDSTRNGDDSISRALSEPEFNYNGNSSTNNTDSIAPNEAASMFERPGFGSVAFINRKITSGALMSLPISDLDSDLESVITNGVAGESDTGPKKLRVRRRGSLTDSIGTVGSLAVRMKHMPWAEEELGLDDDETESSPLELFLASNNLSEYFQLFAKEKIDLPALMLLTDTDMKELGLPMGPRRKLTEALTSRKNALKSPGIVMDTLL